MKLSEHFSLGEFMPPAMYVPPGGPPEDVVVALRLLCERILDPLRVSAHTSIEVTSGWRPARYNAIVGGAVKSDHVTGNAADIQVRAFGDTPWEMMTIESAKWVRDQLSGLYGQVILEDHRATRKDPGKLWIHVSNPTLKHPGTLTDPGRALVSFAPRKYRPWKEDVTE